MKTEDILVIGASGALGGALLVELAKRYPHARVWATYCNEPIRKELVALIHKSICLDVCEQSSFDNFEKETQDLSNLTQLYSALGVLTVGHKTPEKSLRDINLLSFQKVFSINTFSASIVMSIFRNRLNRDTKCRYVFLSAMVGSIEDNSMGGWYSYRASKTALNMLVKNMSIELERLGFKGKVLSIHPGTTYTNLSAEHLTHIKHKVWEPHASAVNIINTANETLWPSGSFLNWNGDSIPW